VGYVCLAGVVDYLLLNDGSSEKGIGANVTTPSKYQYDCYTHIY